MSIQTDLSFGREYTAAVEAKQVGECFYSSLKHSSHSSLIDAFIKQLSKRHRELFSMLRKLSKKGRRRLSRLKERLRLRN